MEFKNVDRFETSEKLRRMMRKAGKTVLDIQYELRLTSPSSVYSWTQGRALPSVDNLVKLTQIFGCTMEDLVVLEGENE